MDIDELIRIATAELLEAVRDGYYNRSDLVHPNYTEICEWCNFPNLQNGGQFEMAIKIAADTVIRITEQN